MNLHNVIIGPMMTEKTEEVKTPRKDTVRYTLKVDMRSSKELIRQALHKIYKVDAKKINTLVIPGKEKRFRSGNYRTPTWKKAIVTLAPGQSIDFTK